jgi:hypothetical protein
MTLIAKSFKKLTPFPKNFLLKWSSAQLKLKLRETELMFNTIKVSIIIGLNPSSGGLTKFFILLFSSLFVVV